MLQDEEEERQNHPSFDKVSKYTQTEEANSNDSHSQDISGAQVEKANRVQQHNRQLQDGFKKVVERTASFLDLLERTQKQVKSLEEKATHLQVRFSQQKKMIFSKDQRVLELKKDAETLKTTNGDLSGMSSIQIWSVILMRT